jgi:hypothetical protein
MTIGQVIENNILFNHFSLGKSCIDCAELRSKWQKKIITGYQLAYGLVKKGRVTNFDGKSTSDREEKYKEYFNKRFSSL